MSFLSCRTQPSELTFSLRLLLQVENISIDSLEKCDFEPMFNYFESEKEKKKSMTAAEKKE